MRIYIFKESGGKCKLDHFSDKGKMPSNFLFVQKGEKIENTWHFQGQESWLEPVSSIKSHIYHSVHLPASRHHHVRSNLWKLVYLRTNVNAVHCLAACCLINDGRRWELYLVSVVNPPRSCPCVLCPLWRFL